MTVQTDKWLVLGGLMLVYAVSNGVVVHTLPLLYPRLIDQFGWTATQMTLPATAFFVFGAVTSPPAGAMLDRFSPCRMTLFGITGLIAGLIGYALMQQLWHLVAIYLLFGLALSFCGLTANMVILTRWFERKRGIATGLLLMASSFGAATFPFLLNAGMDRFDWRGALLLIAASAAVLALLPLVFLVRDRPQDAPARDRPESPRPTAITGPTLLQALRSPSFYLLAFATGAMWFNIVALLQHQSIHLATDLGLDRGRLPQLFSVFFICSILGKLCFAWLGDVINKQITLIVSIATFAVGVLLLQRAGAADDGLLMAYAVITGFGFSGTFSTIQLSIADQFAGPSYGKILAILVMIDSLAGGIGATVVAQLRDASGSYASAFNLMLALSAAAILCVSLIILLARLRPARRPEVQDGAAP